MIDSRVTWRSWDRMGEMLGKKDCLFCPAKATRAAHAANKTATADIRCCDGDVCGAFAEQMALNMIFPNQVPIV